MKHEHPCRSGRIDILLEAFQLNAACWQVSSPDLLVAWNLRLDSLSQSVQEPIFLDKYLDIVGSSKCRGRLTPKARLRHSPCGSVEATLDILPPPFLAGTYRPFSIDRLHFLEYTLQKRF